ncbi:MAG: PAS domain S-box protein, partial [Chloroflexales bacterium]|nr:PAS domain S-box protein [Chloroflexales bacterium]
PRAHRPACVLIDAMLPDMSGLAALATLVEATDGNAPVIMLTGTSNSGLAVEALKLGAQDCLAKDRLIAADLQRAIANTLEKARLRHEQQQTLAALRASEERLRLALDAGRLGTWRHDIATDRMDLDARASFIYAQQSGLRLMDCLARVHPDDVPGLKETIALAHQSATGDGRFAAEFRLIHSGGVRWIATHGRVLFKGTGAARRAVEVIGTSQDITAHKAAEEALRRSEATFTAAFNAGPLVMSITRLANGQFVAVNDSFVQSTGYTREEVLGRTPLELGLWVDPARRDEGLQSLRQGQPPRQTEADFRLKRGEIRTYLLSADRIEINGELCALTALTDITARRQAERILEHYHLLSERTRDIVLFVRPDGGIVEANAAAVAAYGYERATLLALNIDDLRDPATVSLVEPQLAQANQTGILFESIHRRQDGATFPVEVSLIGAELGGERLLMSIIRDIGERKRAEAERLQLLDNAQQARAIAEEAVQVRDQFLSIAAHELKNPLTVLFGNAQLLERRTAHTGELSEPEQRMLRTIREQAHRLNQMITSLLDVSRIEMGQLRLTPTSLDLGILVGRIVEETRLTLTMHTLHYESPAEAMIITGDALRLEQVVQNLIGNAIKYSPAGSPITIRVERRAGVGHISVTDEGIGIPEEALPHLFRRFYRADNTQGQSIPGTGVGLYVVKEIVTRHGGQVSVDSSDGEGSTYAVHLPIR